MQQKVSENYTLSEISTGELSDNARFAWEYHGIRRAFFWIKVFAGFCSAYQKLFFTLLFKRCYYGPFKGEFGHFLVHVLPFLTYLHSRGVKIHYCGMSLHEPFLVDENKKTIIHHYSRLRDFFAEVPPRSNSTVPPPDVREEILKFEQEAKRSSYPFWNIGDDFFYWFVMRQWILRGPYTKTYNLREAYSSKQENSAVIFPRNKGVAGNPNNGGAWDYNELAKSISPYFDKVYFTGHPALSGAVKAEGNIELALSNDNSVILEKCSNARLIISQHSGAVNLGEYTDCKVLVIYNGKPPIRSMQNTLRFKPFLGKKHDFYFAFSVEEVVRFVKQFTGK